MTNRTSHQSQLGSALAWGVIWLAGTAAIIWAGITFAIPSLEEKIQAEVQRSIAPISPSPVDINVTWRQVALSGNITDSQQRQLIIDATSDVLGVKTVIDQLSGEVSQAHESMSDKTENHVNAPQPSDTSDGNQSPSAPNNTESNTTSVDQTASLEEGSSTATLPSESELPFSEQALPSTSTQPQAAELPSLTLRVANGLLALEGTLSEQDNPDEFIQEALSTFNAEIVSNSIRARENIMSAEWLTSLQHILPMMQNLNEPRLDVIGRQITLSGLAPDAQTRDDVISEALTTLGEYSLIERIGIEEPLNPPSTADTWPVEAGTDESSASETPDDDSSDTESPETNTPDTEQHTDRNALDTEHADAASTDTEHSDADAPDDTDASPDAERETERPDLDVQDTESSKSDASASEYSDTAPLDTENAETPPSEEIESSDVNGSDGTPASNPDTQATDVEASEPQYHTLEQALAALPSLRILFKSQVNELTPDSLQVLDQIADTMIEFPGSNLVIEGHTDATGDNETNLHLSLARATKVRDYLVSKGVSVFNLRAIGYGEEVPIADNSTPEGRAINRRIDFTF